MNIKIGDLVEVTNPVTRKLREDAGLPIMGIVMRIDPDGVTEVKSGSNTRFTPHVRVLSVIPQSTMPWRN